MGQSHISRRVDASNGAESKQTDPPIDLQMAHEARKEYQVDINFSATLHQNQNKSNAKRDQRQA